LNSGFGKIANAGFGKISDLCLKVFSKYDFWSSFGSSEEEFANSLLLLRIVFKNLSFGLASATRKRQFVHGFSLRPRVGAGDFLVFMALFYRLKSSGRTRPTNRLFPGLHLYVSR